MEKSITAAAKQVRKGLMIETCLLFAVVTVDEKNADLVHVLPCRAFYELLCRHAVVVDIVDTKRREMGLNTGGIAPEVVDHGRIDEGDAPAFSVVSERPGKHHRGKAAI